MRWLNSRALKMLSSMKIMPLRKITFEVFFFFKVILFKGKNIYFLFYSLMNSKVRILIKNTKIYIFYDFYFYLFFQIFKKKKKI